jgi:hypothetical protein
LKALKISNIIQLYFFGVLCSFALIALMLGKLG